MVGEKGRDRLLLALAGVALLALCHLLASRLVASSNMGEAAAEWLRLGRVLLALLPGGVVLLVGLYRCGGSLQLVHKGPRLLTLLLIFLLSMLGVAGVTSLIQSAFYLPVASEALPNQATALLLAYLRLCILPAILEEFVFRAGLLGLLLPFGKLPAVLLSALVFAALHGLGWGLPAALAAGLLLGLFYARGASLAACILLHFTYNSLAFLWLAWKDAIV